MINMLREEFLETHCVATSTTKGVEELAKVIGISKNSLRRFLGKLNDSGNLRISTLNLIAERLGYSGFQDFCNTAQNKNFNIDFDTLDIYYNCVKGKGTRLNDINFQKANYYFSERIISNPYNLKEFLRRYADNHEAMEYVLGWHPSYTLIAKPEYQKVLAHVAKLSKYEHIKVFAYSFILFGKYKSDNLLEEEAEKSLKKITKHLVKMRDEEKFYTFPEARFKVARIIRAGLKDKPEKIISEIAEEPLPTGIPFGERLIYFAFVSDILNQMELYEQAQKCLHEFFDKPQAVNQFEEENCHYTPHIFLAKINMGISLFKTGNLQASIKLFNEILQKKTMIKNFSFDSVDYFNLRFYYFASLLYPKNKSFGEKQAALAKKLNFNF